MSRTWIAPPKFVGTMSLGLLTGTSYALSSLAVPPLLSLPTFPRALTTFNSLRAESFRQQLALTLLSSTSLLFAYIVSPSEGRHPYLLWTAAVVVGSAGPDAWAGYTEWEQQKKKGARRGKLQEEEVNGEAVREGMESWRSRQVIRAGISAVAFAMSVVGIWGDGL